MSTDVAISAFQSDYSVLELVRRIREEAWPVRHIRVLDSLGGGGLQAALADAFPDVVYENATANLGSAGNLALRIKQAAASGADFVLALNHDAAIGADAVRALVRHAEASGPTLGALYPLAFYPSKGFYGLTGTRDFPMRRWGSPTVPDQPLVPVYWSSSNGALYALRPVREHHLCSDASLWMGWEDYLYGLELHQAGYTQYLVTEALVEDSYEFKSVHMGPIRMMLNDKPTWYVYYSVRNMLRVVLHRAPSVGRVSRLGVWLVLMAGQLLVNRPRDGFRKALTYFLLGLRDGLANRSGKWILPVGYLVFIDLLFYSLLA